MEHRILISAFRLSCIYWGWGGSRGPEQRDFKREKAKKGEHVDLQERDSKEYAYVASKKKSHECLVLLYVITLQNKMK